MRASTSLAASSSCNDSSILVLMYTRWAAIATNSLATSKSNVCRWFIQARYWSKMRAIWMSAISILFLLSNSKIKSSGPSKFSRSDRFWYHPVQVVDRYVQCHLQPEEVRREPGQLTQPLQPPVPQHIQRRVQQAKEDQREEGGHQVALVAGG